MLNVQGRDRLLVPLDTVDPKALLVDALHPTVGPMHVRATHDHDGVSLQPLPAAWDQSMDPGQQVAALVRRATARPVRGSNDRTLPLTGPLSGKRVLLAGLGSVGSRIGEDLLRSGADDFLLIDPDRVEPANLSRTVYTAADIGRRKTDVLGQRLQEINPAARVRTIPTTITDAGDLGELLLGVELVVGATDDMPQQGYLAHHAYAAGVPMVTCGLFRRAAAGEVVLQVPGGPCWSCAVGAGSHAAGQRPSADYGAGGRLVGELALGPSIQLVSSVASQAAVGLLGGPSTPAGRHLTDRIRDGRVLGLVSTVPEWDIFTDVFRGMPHQFAPQSIWPRVARSEHCPVCGPDAEAPTDRAAGEQLLDLLGQLTGDESLTP